MNEKAQTMMMLDIDGVLTQHHATPTDVLTAAQLLAVSAIGDLTNKANAVPDSNVQSSMVNVQSRSEALHRLADGIADQIRTAMHARIDAGPRPDW